MAPAAVDDLSDRVEPAPRHTARLRAVLSVLVLGTAVPLVLFAALLIYNSWEEQIAVVDRQNVDTARAISVTIDKEVERAEAALQVMASLNALNDPDLLRFEAIALRLLAAQPGWRSLLLADPEGNVLFDSAAQPGETTTLHGAEWLPKVLARRQPVASDLFTTVAGEHFFAIAVPVIRSESVKLVLAARIPATRLSDVLHHQNTPPGGVVTLLDGRRIIMARTRGETRYVGGPPSAGFQAASARMTEGSWRETLLEGTASYAALHTSPNTGWTLGLGIAAEEIDAPIRRSLWLLTAVGATVLLLGLALALVIGERIVRTLTSATEAVHALASGRPVNMQSSRITEFDQLATDVRDAAAILDARLRERDRALAAEREAHATSEAAQARLAVTLQSIGDAVVTTDAKGRITLLNPIGQALTGWSETDARGEPVETVIRILEEGTRQPLENPVTKVLRDGKIAGAGNRTVLLRARDGHECPIEDSAAPIRGADGALLGTVLVFRDATERRQAEVERGRLLELEQNARRAAEALSRSKDDFVATVSHELRTPLQAMLGWAELLRDGDLDNVDRRRAVEVLERNTRIQMQLINDLLDMSRILTGQMKLTMRRVNLLSVLKAAVDVVRPTARARNIDLTLLADGPPTFVAGDSDRLQQIVWNLLANSVKFTPKGGRIELRMTNEGDDAVVRVSDNGSGITADLLPHIFERFRRGSLSSGQGGGLGIGLALVRHLVELHGGTVTAESAGAGRGTTFVVRLPLNADERPPVVTERSALEDQMDRSQLAGRRVLVIDDSADAREVVAAILEQGGAQVGTAASVADALRQLESSRPDAVICDLEMPEASGYDFLRKVRAIPRLAGLPVIALTAYARPDDQARALRAGFDEHLAKPVEADILVTTVRRLLSSFAGPRPST